MVAVFSSGLGFARLLPYLRGVHRTVTSAWSRWDCEIRQIVAIWFDRADSGRSGEIDESRTSDPNNIPMVVLAQVPWPPITA